MKRVLLGLAAAALLLAGCGDPTKPGNNGTGLGDGVNTFCDGPTRVYTYDADGGGGGIAVIPNDPRCGGTP